ncbi:MAG TPA: GNAT family N-acetyltransferase [Solirubrobacterales bacterium]
MRQELERILGSEIARDEAVAQRAVELDGLTAFIDTRMPDVWDANYLRVDRRGLDIEAILAAGEESLGAAGVGHRAIFPYDEREGERLAAELGPRGWKIERNFYMVHRRPPDRSGAVAVEEVTLDALEDARRAFLGPDQSDWSDDERISAEAVDQFLLRDRLYGEAGGDRWFVAREEGEVVSFCRLLADDDTAQVEDVGTLLPARGRGFARAVILAAVRAARSDGDRLVWLSANAEDWPRKLYERLGFELAGGDVRIYLDPPGSPRG